MTKTTKPKSKVGRPRKAGSRSSLVMARLTDEEHGMLRYLVANGGESYSNVMRIALRLYYHMVRAHED